MKILARFFYEFTESIRIAWAQIRANKMRSVLTALGVIIGIVAVTLMGTAIRGIDTGFNDSLAMLGDDVLYVQKWPWGPTEDWWNYVNRPSPQAAEAERLNAHHREHAEFTAGRRRAGGGARRFGESGRQQRGWHLRLRHHG